MIKGMLLRMPTLLYAMFGKGFIPFSEKDAVTTFPAEFLVDERGINAMAYYGKDSGGQLAFDKVKA